MRGGKLLPLHGDSEPTSQLKFETSLGIGWGQSSTIYFKKTPFIKPGAGEALRQSANGRALFGGFCPLGVRAELSTRANAKKAIFRVFHKELSAGECHKSVFRSCH